MSCSTSGSHLAPGNYAFARLRKRGRNERRNDRRKAAMREFSDPVQTNGSQPLLSGPRPKCHSMNRTSSPDGPPAPSPARRTSPRFREGLRDVEGNRLRVREGDVGHHGNGEPALGTRHEVDRGTDEVLLAAMARHSRGLARQGMRLEVPANAVSRLRAGGQPLRWSPPWSVVTPADCAISCRSVTDHCSWRTRARAPESRRRDPTCASRGALRRQQK